MAAALGASLERCRAAACRLFWHGAARPAFSLYCAHTAARVDPFVDVGGAGAAADPAFVRARGYTHILSLAPGGREHPGVRRLVIPAADAPDYPLGLDFAACFAFIRDAVRRRGRVLVHCQAGISRSPTVVAAYLVAERGLRLDEAFAQVRRARPMARPNPGFWAILEDLDRACAAARKNGGAPAGGQKAVVCRYSGTGTGTGADASAAGAAGAAGVAGAAGGSAGGSAIRQTRA
jgi:atypical dual specificity phosphatase